MALEPLAKSGNFFHIYDFRVKPGKGEEFIKLFDDVRLFRRRTRCTNRRPR